MDFQFPTGVGVRSSGSGTKPCSRDVASESKKEDRDQESIQSSTTPDQGYHGKVTTSQLEITNESQEISPFPAGDHKASTNRRV